MDDVYTGFFPSPIFLVVIVALWVILSLIPIVNYFFYIYIAYSVILGILYKLNALEGRMGVVDT